MEMPKLSKRQSAEVLREDLKYRVASEMMLAALETAAEAEGAEADLAALVEKCAIAERTLLDVRARIAREDEAGRQAMAAIHARIQEAEAQAQKEISDAGKDALTRIAAEREKAKRDVAAVRTEAEAEIARLRGETATAQATLDALNGQLAATRAQLAPFMVQA